MPLPATPSSSLILVSLFLSLVAVTTLHAVSASEFEEREAITASLAKAKELEANPVLIRGNRTIVSENQTFELGFFNINGEEHNFHLAIRYVSVSTPTFVWVANREKPSKNIAETTLEITETGRLAVKDSSKSILWQSTNTEASTEEVKLLDNGNLVLLTPKGSVSWQSFDYPTNTWLPGMNLTRDRYLVSWRSPTDPSPGSYSLRLKPPSYGEFELVFNNTKSYWTSGNWTGEAFRGVPEMTIPYIYRFHFTDPFTPTASFGFSEKSLDNGLRPPTFFRVESDGQVRQYTWWQQSGSWNMFWYRPENLCEAPGLCGNLGICTGEIAKPCECLSGFKPVDERKWGSGDYSGGCRHESDALCDESDGFEELGSMSFNESDIRSFPCNSRSFCETVCLNSCLCIGLSFNENAGLCKNFYGSILNLQNSTSSGSSGEDVLYIRVQRGGSVKKRLNRVALTAIIIGSVAVMGVTVVTLWMSLKRRLKRKKLEEDGLIPVLNLQFFSYKELQLATRGFSEKVGHGGFGTVFQGELPDSTLVAVKRLERPGGGEKEFRAEVSTIGNIQHVNLVRLRGFCSENSHRLLVYEYMPNGALSAYLRKEGPSLSWDVRFRVAIGTAKGIAYLHEECRDCIIHCDIKPENILLDSNFTAKVSDFGLAKLIGRDFSRVLATMRGTWGYLAPEWISGVAITTKADVYSYGMTLLELIGGRRNVEPPPSAGGRESGYQAGEKWFFPPWAARQIIEGNVAAVVDKRLGNAYNNEEARRIALVAVWCIQDDEEMRPTMGMVVKMLEGLVEVSVPPSPKLLQALVTGESFHGVKVDSGDGLSTGGSSSGGNLEGSTAGSESFTVDISTPTDFSANVR